MKNLKSIFSVALLATAFTACEDIPMPYEINLGEDKPETSVYYSSTALNSGWELQAEGDLQPWSQSSSYTQATGYQDWDGTGTKSNKEVTGWLISPAFHTVAETGKVKFYFDYTLRYTDRVSGYANNHKIYVTDNFTGDAKTTTWTELSWKPSPSTYSDWTTYGSGDIQLPDEFVNKEGVRLAFWFYAPASASTTWELLNFYLEEGVAGEQGGNEGGGDTPDTKVNGVPYTSASLKEGWKTWAASGKNNPWSQGSSYTQATGYQKWEGDSKSNREVDGYLISPAFNTTVASGKVKMSFENCVGYASNDPDYAKHVKLYISKTADGSNFNAAEWEQFDWTATHETTNWTLTTDEVQLPEAYVGQENVHVAFWFYAPADKSSTFELKNFKLLEGEVGQSGPDNGGGGDDQISAGEGVVISGTTVVASNPKATASEEFVTIDFNTLGYNNEDKVTVVEAEGCTITFDKAAGTTDPKFYSASKGVRVYAKNTIAFECPGKVIAKVEMNCDTYSGTNYVGNPTAIATVAGNALVYTNEHSEAKGGVQLRVQKVKIYFAK